VPEQVGHRLDVNAALKSRDRRRVPQGVHADALDLGGLGGDLDNWGRNGSEQRQLPRCSTGTRDVVVLGFLDRHYANQIARAPGRNVAGSPS
jgi:hypothetical protein